MVRNVCRALECGLRWTCRRSGTGTSHDAGALARQQSNSFASTSTPAANVTHYVRIAVRHAANSAHQGSAGLHSSGLHSLGSKTGTFVSFAARDAAHTWANHAQRTALPWHTKLARAAWQSIPRLLKPPKLDITGSLWNMALASPKLMSNPAALCAGLPFVKEARYYMRSFDGGHYMRTFDGLRAQHLPQFPTRAQVDAALRRSMDALQSYTSTLSTSSLCTTLITSMNIVGKNHALMLGIVIAEALNRSTSDCLAVPVVLPPRAAYEELTFNWFDPSLTWREWAEVVFREMRESVLNMLHVVHLLVLFTPVALCAPLALYWGWGRASWLEKLRESLEAAGPAFIKWGQWAATRQDMFPNDMCKELSLLQVRAPSHKFAYTKRTLEESFGTKVEDLFDWLEEEPVASGSVGQVHRGRLSKRGAEICGMSGVHEGKIVAVKVKHPGVSASIQRDFGLMMWAAHWLEWYPMLRKMRLQESLSQFAAPLREQVDLSLEANNLWRFNQNFCKDDRVSLPVPLYPWVSQDVLVESFEEGMHISTYMDMDKDTRRRAAVADVGSATMLNMMLVHNLIHSDLHPGNILVRWQLPRGWIVSAAAGLLQAFNSEPAKVMNGWLQPHVVLLDVGMATELSSDDRYNMFHLFKGFAEKDGQKMAKAALAFAGKEQRCIDPEGFQQEISRKMAEIVSCESWEESEFSNSAAAFSSVLDTVRDYEVTLPGHICAVLVTTLVLEGWSSELAPDHSVLEEVKSVVANDNKNWRERLNLTVDQLMGWSPVLPSLDAA